MYTFLKSFFIETWVLRNRGRKKLDRQIFVSHSRYDTEIRKEFSEVFAVARGASPIYMEFEEFFPPAWEKIRHEIYLSEALFVLLGPNIHKTIHTQNWVAFEVGLACAFGKEVWVFEQAGSYVEFPIHYLTDYSIYDLKDRTHFKYLRKVIKGYGKPNPVFPPFKNHRVKRDIPIGMLTTCCYNNCGSSFLLHTKIESFNCPSCRQGLKIEANTQQS